MNILLNMVFLFFFINFLVVPTSEKVRHKLNCFFLGVFERAVYFIKTDQVKSNPNKTFSEVYATFLEILTISEVNC